MVLGGAVPVFLVVKIKPGYRGPMSQLMVVRIWFYQDLLGLPLSPSTDGISILPELYGQTQKQRLSQLRDFK